MAKNVICTEAETRFRVAAGVLGNDSSGKPNDLAAGTAGRVGDVDLSRAVCRQEEGQRGTQVVRKKHFVLLDPLRALDCGKNSWPVSGSRAILKRRLPASEDFY